MKKNILVLLLSVAAAVIFSFGTVACGNGNSESSAGGSGNASDISEEAAVLSVRIGGAQLVFIGYTITLDVIVEMSDDSVYSGDIVWESSDESVATVSNGVVTGVSGGFAQIIATAGGFDSAVHYVIVRRASDVVDAAGWVEVMTSEDMLYSTFTCVETDATASLSTISNGMVELGTDGDIVTGVTYYSDEITNTLTNAVTNNYYCDVIDQTRYATYTYVDGIESCYIKQQSENGFTLDDVSIIPNFYPQINFADESYFGGDYFNFSVEEGAYVWEYTSGSYTYCYIIKIYDGNVGYLKITKTGSGDYESENEIEISYSYSGNYVAMPDGIEEKLLEVMNDN